MDPELLFATVGCHKRYFGYVAGPSLIVAPTVQKARWSTKRKEKVDKSFVLPLMQMKVRVTVNVDH